MFRMRHHTSTPSRALFRRSVLIIVACFACARSKDKPRDTVAELELAATRHDAPALKDSTVAPTPQLEKPTPTPSPKSVKPIPKEVAIVQAATPAPTTPAPAPKPEIPAATQFSARFSTQMCDSKLKVGDEISATTAQVVNGTNGGQLMPGARVVFNVSQIIPPTDTMTAMPIVLRAKSVEWDGQAMSLDAELRSVQSERVKHAMDKSKIVKGAIVGAIGGLLRRNVKSVAEGAAAGAAVGTAFAAATRDYDVCIPASSLIVLRLNSPLQKAQ
jgi:hypothetical protein